MRRFALRASLAVAALVTTFLVAAPVPALADTVPPTNYTPITVTDLPQPSFLLTQTDGGVTTGCSNPDGAALFRTYGASGAATQSRPAPTNYATGTYYNTCPRNAVVGADGTLYTLTYTNTFAIAKLEAIKNNTTQWTYTLPCGATSMPGLVVGLNGTLYMVVRGTHTPCAANLLVGVNPSGQEVLDQALDVTNYVMEGGISAYSSGVVIRTNTDIQYVTYAGAVTTYTPTDMQPGGFANYIDTSLTGRALVSVSGTQANRNLCGDQHISGGLYAYDPSGVAWSYNSLPACSDVYESRPTPSGGFVVHYASPAGGVVGNDRQEYLLALDDAGHQLWQLTLTSTDPSNYTTNTTFMVDINGNVAVQRQFQYRLYTGGTYYPFPAVQLQHLDGLTGALLGSYEISGDHDTPGGDGYKLSGNGNYELDIAKNTWYVALAHCSTANNCNFNQSTLYAVTVPGLQMDYPRGGAVLSPASPKNYAALGDSFSSGEGVPPFVAGTDTAGPPENRCHRSMKAYGPLMGATPTTGWALTDTLSRYSFVACSGARTIDLLTGQYNEGPQVDVLNTNTRIVTLTIGGNDIGFADFAASCIFNGPYSGGCDTTSAYANILSAIQYDLPSKLRAAYEGIQNNIGTQTRVLVLGYPMLISDTSMNTFANCPYLDDGEKVAARDVITRLNVAIQNAVREVNNARQIQNFEYVDPNYTGSPFQGHEVCTTASYFNAAQTPKEYSMHPNAFGQAAYRQILLQHLM